ncbi:MAG: hypothetical protein IJD98_07500 [Oscillospiraceae bacterium]|nr:hypothetical protein [Oscillospiraceae bacterium]
MRKHSFLILFLVLLLLLPGCQKGGDVEYMQKVLKQPDSIEVAMGSSTVCYEPDSPQYRKLYEALSATWFQTTFDTPETAAPESLFVAQTPEDLKTTSAGTYLQNDQRVIRFLYSGNMLWYHKANDASNIRLIAFLLPEAAETSDHIRGFFTASETGDMGINLGLYTHYYPAEMVNSFWDFLKS